jgi:maltooligosyltrehalose trehalohydrolase
MTRFEVWAPDAGRVEVVLGERRLALQAAGEWWSTDVASAGAGTDYAFSVDGGPPRPDPRSRWQPQGVHGPSRVLDEPRPPPSSWTGVDLGGAVLYELHVGTFTPAGTFDAAVERLDHLVALGVTAVEVMPVAAFDGEWGWGYDGVAPWAVHEPYGGPAGFGRFVAACHQRGLGVVLDVVYNHLGPSGNYLAEFGPYFTDRYRTPWGPAVNLDGAGSDEVRSFLIGNALWWLGGYGVDALRVDATHELHDESPTHLLEELAAAVDELAAASGRPLWVIAESDRNDPRIVRSRAAGGLGVHAQWSDDFHHAVHVALTGERDGYYQDFGIDDVAPALRRGFVYVGQRSAYRRRRHGRDPTGMPPWRLVGYAQNHDQVGNRALGERLSHLAGLDAARVAAALVLTSPFVPLLFMGEEWAATAPFQYFADHRDPGLADAVRKGRQLEFAAFGWHPDDVPDPCDPATFRRSKLDWSELDRSEHRGMLAWYRDLSRLRRERPELTDGRPATAAIDTDHEVLRVERGALVVVANLSASPRTVDGEGTVLLASHPAVRHVEEVLHLPPRSVAILDRS